MHPALEIVRSCIVGTPFEGDVFLVGGAVRDEILGLPGSDDLDLVTTGPSATLVQLLWDRGVCDFYPVVYERFGTAMISICGQKIEVVRTRKESYASRSRKPSVEPGTLRDDAERRDFTVNTLMRSLSDWSLVDPLGAGVSDLQAGVLRTPLEPRKTFHDDPLRMLRAVRFRHRFGFSYADGLAEAIRKSAPRLEIISAERIRDELFKMMLHPAAEAALEDLRELGLLQMFLPEFISLKGCEQGKWHHLDAWDHTRAVVGNVHALAARRSEPVDLVTVLASLFHDVAKPQTRTEPEPGEVHFYGHDHEGAKVARLALKRLKVPNDMSEEVAFLVENHMRLSSANQFGKAAIRRLIRDMGNQLERFLDLCEADRLGHKDPTPLSEFRQRVAQALIETPVESLESPLSGEEIMQLLQLEPGKAVGEWKTRLVEAVLEGNVTNVESARSWLLEQSQQ
jgi:poly(A) polymerase